MLANEGHRRTWCTNMIPFKCLSHKKYSEKICWTCLRACGSAGGRAVCGVLPWPTPIKHPEPVIIVWGSPSSISLGKTKTESNYGEFAHRTTITQTFCGFQKSILRFYYSSAARAVYRRSEPAPRILRNLQENVKFFKAKIEAKLLFFASWTVYTVFVLC